MVKGRWNVDIIQLHEQYGRLLNKYTRVGTNTLAGNLVRIAPNEVSINSPSAIQQIYGHGKSPWVKVLLLFHP